MLKWWDDMLLQNVSYILFFSYNKLAILIKKFVVFVYVMIHEIVHCHWSSFNNAVIWKILKLILQCIKLSTLIESYQNLIEFNVKARIFYYFYNICKKLLNLNFLRA